MSEDWIKVRHCLTTHPKIARMASALKADVFRTLGAVMSTWSFFDIHSESGTLKNFRSEMLDAHLGWSGFSAAMIDVDWLADDGENLSIPRFHQQNGRSAKRRALDAARKRRVRKESASQADRERTRKEKKSVVKKKERVDGAGVPCPDADIRRLYADVLPELTQHRIWTEKDHNRLAMCWHLMPDLGRWREFFGYVRESDFLMGQTSPALGHSKPFCADLRWLIEPEHFANTMDGKYHGGGHE